MGAWTSQLCLHGHERGDFHSVHTVLTSLLRALSRSSSFHRITEPISPSSQGMHLGELVSLSVKGGGQNGADWGLRGGLGADVSWNPGVSCVPERCVPSWELDKSKLMTKAGTEILCSFRRAFYYIYLIFCILKVVGRAPYTVLPSPTERVWRGSAFIPKVKQRRGRSVRKALPRWPNVEGDLVPCE